MTQRLQRGDIVLVRFPFTDLSGSKRRPALVLATYSPDVIVAFVSSVLPTVPGLSEIVLQPAAPSFTATGLKVGSVIRLTKLATLEQSLITRLLGHLNQDLLRAVDDALVGALGVDINRYLLTEYRRLLEMFQNQGQEAVLTYIQSKQL